MEAFIEETPSWVFIAFAIYALGTVYQPRVLMITLWAVALVLIGVKFGWI